MYVIIEGLYISHDFNIHWISFNERKYAYLYIIFIYNGYKRFKHIYLCHVFCVTESMESSREDKHSLSFSLSRLLVLIRSSIRTGYFAGTRARQSYAKVKGIVCYAQYEHNRPMSDNNIHIPGYILVHRIKWFFS